MLSWLYKFTTIYETVYLIQLNFMMFKLYFNEAVKIKKQSRWYMEKALNNTRHILSTPYLLAVTTLYSLG